jgi:hypothetical protein
LETASRDVTHAEVVVYVVWIALNDCLAGFMDDILAVYGMEGSQEEEEQEKGRLARPHFFFFFG